MLTPLEREQHEALLDLYSLALKTIVMCGTDEEYARIRLEKAAFAIAKAEAKERESAQAAHERMIALRLAEMPDDDIFEGYR